ncbi:MAG: MarR family winged helix-turn-helix transcriptional regulator [Flavobacteriales bacterium]
MSKTNRKIDVGNPYENIVQHLKQTIKWLEKDNSIIFKRNKITQSHYSVLKILYCHSQDSLRPKEIRSLLLDEKVDLTRIIDKLVKNAFVERIKNSMNRREINISLTAEGLSFFEAISKDIKSPKQLLNHIGIEELNHLNSTLNNIRNRKKETL